MNMFNIFLHVIITASCPIHIAPGASWSRPARWPFSCHCAGAKMPTGRAGGWWRIADFTKFIIFIYNIIQWCPVSFAAQFNATKKSVEKIYRSNWMCGFEILAQKLGPWPTRARLCREPPRIRGQVDLLVEPHRACNGHHQVGHQLVGCWNTLNLVELCRTM